jgi:hypothetical protein
MASSKLPEGELAFNYFPDHYRWSHGLLIAPGGAPWGGGEIDEINRIGLRLKHRVGDDAAWFAEWAGVVERMDTFRGGYHHRQVDNAASAPPCVICR